MTSTEMKAFRKQLVKMVQRLGGESEHLRQEVLGDGRQVGTTPEQFTDDDLSRETADEEIALGVLGTEEELLAECRGAIERIDAGTYGKCAKCGHAIAAGRLEAAPYARDCIRCARVVETKRD